MSLNQQVHNPVYIYYRINYEIGIQSLLLYKSENNMDIKVNSADMRRGQGMVFITSFRGYLAAMVRFSPRDYQRVVRDIKTIIRQPLDSGYG